MAQPTSQPTVRLISRAGALRQPLLRAWAGDFQRLEFAHRATGLGEPLSPAQALAEGFEPDVIDTPALTLIETYFYHPTLKPAEYVGQLSASLKLVLKAYGAPAWRCVPVLCCPLLWNSFYRYNPLPRSFHRAVRQLKKWGAGPKYRGAFYVPSACTGDFVRVLYWLERHEAFRPCYVLLAPETDQFVAALGSLGNLVVQCPAAELAHLRLVFQQAGLREGTITEPEWMNPALSSRRWRR